SVDRRLPGAQGRCLAPQSSAAVVQHSILPRLELPPPRALGELLDCRADQGRSIPGPWRVRCQLIEHFEGLLVNGDRNSLHIVHHHGIAGFEAKAPVSSSLMQMIAAAPT